MVALSDWPDAAAWEPLAYTCRNPEDSAQHGAALRGLARLFSEQAGVMGNRTTSSAQELLDVARTDADLKLVLGALGQAKDAGVLRLVLPLLDKPAVRAEAEVAVRKIAAAIREQDPEASRQALERLNQK